MQVRAGSCRHHVPACGEGHTFVLRLHDRFHEQLRAGHARAPLDDEVRPAAAVATVSRDDEANFEPAFAPQPTERSFR